MDTKLMHGATMKQNLHTSFAIVTLILAATVSVSEVNAQEIIVQSNYAAQSGWQPWQSLPVYGTPSPVYPSATLSSQTYQPQSQNSYWVPPRNRTWSPPYSQSSAPVVGQVPVQTPTPIYRGVTNVQRAPFNPPAITVQPPAATRCQAGGT